MMDQDKLARKIGVNAAVVMLCYLGIVFSNLLPWKLALTIQTILLAVAIAGTMAALAWPMYYSLRLEWRKQETA